MGQLCTATIVGIVVVALSILSYLGKGASSFTPPVLGQSREWLRDLGILARF
jgi:hypothetical protein